MKMYTLSFSLLMFIVFGAIEARAIEQSICNPGSQVTFYPDGSLMSCVLKEDLRSNGITCRQLLPVGFYANGQLERCSLAEKATISDQECKEFSPISFYPDGKFKSCVKEE